MQAEAPARVRRASPCAPRRLSRFAVSLLDAISPRLAGRYALRTFTTPKRTSRPPWEAETLRGAERREIGRCAVWSWGFGPAVLLVHGWEGRGTQLGAFVRPLLDRGLRAVAVDAPAHGDSAGRRTDPVEYGRVLRTVAGEVGTVRAAVAHSFGGMALAHALGTGLRLERVVLIASVCSYLRGTERRAKELKLSPAALAHFQEKLGRRLRAPLAEVDVARLAAGFDIPALLLHDPADAEIPFAIAELIARLWRGARLLPLPGTGHRGILKSEAAVSAVDEFFAPCAAP